jgi:hemerythrin-like domain-containing protein/nucleotide-binding universal stress UspA family protein
LYRHLLVPVDCSDASIEGVGNAVGLARAVGARVTFVHAAASVAASPPDRDEGSQGEAAGLLAKAEAAARAVGVPCNATQAWSDRPAAAIVEVARDSGCDLIFLAAPPAPGTALAEDMMSAVAAVGLPMLWSSAAAGPPAHAIAMLRDEHRSLAAVLHAWLRALAAARSADQAADPASMRTVVRYLQVFAAALHHPKEEAHLFRRLRDCTSSLNAELDELERQHGRDRELVAELTRHVDELSEAQAAAAVRATRRLEADALRYAAFQWEHLGREEGVVLPAAARHFTPADWAAVEADLLRDRDLHCSRAAEAEAGRLYSRIVNVAGSAP